LPDPERLCQHPDTAATTVEPQFGTTIEPQFGTTIEPQFRTTIEPQFRTADTSWLTALIFRLFEQ